MVFFWIIILVGPIGQFALFRFTPLFDLSLFSNLYDDAAWVFERPKVLVMGSSHAKHHIIPAEIALYNDEYTFDDVVNVGENAATPFRMYRTFMENREKFTDLETLYYTLEPHILSEKYYIFVKYEKILLSYQQWMYLEEHGGHINSYFYPLQLFVDALSFERVDRSKTNGYSPLKHSSFNLFSRGQVSDKAYEPIELFPVSMFDLDYLKKLKEVTESQGTKFILVLTPTYTWHTYYKEEASAYDDILIAQLRSKLGPGVIIGSFWPEDFDLEFEDFKDETHLAHSGAIKFTRALFGNIKEHSALTPQHYQNTFTYRFESTNSITMKPIFRSNNPQSHWIANSGGSFKPEDDCDLYSSRDIDQHAMISLDIGDVRDVDEVRFSMRLPDEKLRLISITLRSGKDFGHFFIKPANFADGNVNLHSYDVDKSSENFSFTKLESISIRLYPLAGNTINNFCVKALDFLRIQDESVLE